MKTIDLSEVTALAPHVQPGSHEPIVLTENGRTVAAILPSDEQGVESMLLSLSPKFNAILDRSQQRLEAEGGLSAADLRARLGIAAKGPLPEG